jgi:hypothetical protein
MLSPWLIMPVFPASLHDFTNCGLAESEFNVS